MVDHKVNIYIYICWSQKDFQCFDPLPLSEVVLLIFQLALWKLVTIVFCKGCIPIRCVDVLFRRTFLGIRTFGGNEGKPCDVGSEAGVFNRMTGG